MKAPVILVINKVDTIKKEEILPVIDRYKNEVDFVEIIPVLQETATIPMI